MPFRCRCGRTFEKTDSFASHTSACAPFHHRRMSDTSQLSSNQLPSRILSQQVTSSDSVMSVDTNNHDLSSSVPNNSSFFMPTGLSLQNAFEGARRRSMSYGSK
jgi:hypothetical protein